MVCVLLIFCTYESPSMMGDKEKQAPVKESTIKREAYFMDYMEKVRKLVNTPLVVTGGFRSAPAMNEALNTSATDFIGIARTMAVDPDFPNKLIENPNHGMPLIVPTTGKPALDKVGMVGLVWYEHQMWRIAAGKNADPKLSALGVVF